jgi:hypothetical protein
MRADAGFLPTLNFRVFQQYLRTADGCNRQSQGRDAIVAFQLMADMARAEFFRTLSVKLGPAAAAIAAEQRPFSLAGSTYALSPQQDRVVAALTKGRRCLPSWRFACASPRTPPGIQPTQTRRLPRCSAAKQKSKLRPHPDLLTVSCNEAGYEYN